MVSQYQHLKAKALTLRLKGASIRDVERILSIPRSTLSGWFKTIQLTTKQRNKLKEGYSRALITARKKAVLWHNTQKAKRIAIAKTEARKVLSRIIDSDAVIVEIALAFLYLGEGSKRNGSTSLGNSDPTILKFFVNCMHQLYDVRPEEMRCYLHLRADQDETAMKKHWVRKLGIPAYCFRKTSFDTRTAGRPTYPDYKGVCVVDCARVAIQRRLRYIASGFCKRVHARK